MNPWILPTKKQVLFVCGITVFLFLRIMSTTDLLSSEKYSNRQYLIFGVLMALAFLTSIVAIVLYKTRRVNNVK